jgi:hypothetical protein
MHRNPRRFAAPALAIAAAALALASACGGARAQTSVLLDPSARSGGMGGASTAVPWSGTPNLWANPALVTAVPGFSAEVTTEQLVPGFAADVRFGTTRFVASFAGLGYSSSGRPLGAIDLDPGVFNPRGVPWTASYAGAERVWADGFGVSATSLADAIAAATGHRARFADWGDLAWGRQWKRIRLDGYLGVPRASTYDEGWLARLSPLDSRRGAAPPVGGVRAEIAWGHAVLDASDARLEWSGFPGLVQSPVWRVRRDGGAVRLAWYGPARGGAPGASFADAFRGGLGPLLDLTLAVDHEHVFLPGAGYSGSDYRVRQYGAEATLVRVLTGRFGYVDDRTGGITKPAWGLGACLPLSRNGEVRYDFASMPQAYPRRVFRHQVAVRVDPLTRWFGARPEGGGAGGEHAFASREERR